MKYISVTFFFFSIYLIGCTSSRPLWMNETPKGYESDYFVGNGTSTVSETDAHEQALVNAVQRINQSGEIVVSSEEKSNSQTKETFQNGNSDLQRTDNIADAISSDWKIYANGTNTHVRWNELTQSMELSVSIPL